MSGPVADPAAAEDKSAQQAAKLEALKARLSSEAEGIEAAKKLVQGGELKQEADITSHVFMHRWVLCVYCVCNLKL